MEDLVRVVVRGWKIPAHTCDIIQVRLKMWKTPSRERVCEVQPLEGNSSGCTQRYTQYQPRRYSDFALTTIPAVPARRRASEMPPRVPPPVPPRTGIVCTNTDLISILSSLTSSATEIDRCGTEEEDTKSSTSAVKTIEQKRNRWALLTLLHVSLLERMEIHRVALVNALTDIPFVCNKSSVDRSRIIFITKIYILAICFFTFEISNHCRSLKN
jgi:hypothetical protein